MAELAALEGGISLASSIITFIEFSIEFGKLVRQLAQSQGSLPKELEECRDYINVVAAWLKNIERTIPAPPQAEEDLLLEQAVERCQNTAGTLMNLLQTLCGNVATDEKKTSHRARTALRDVKRAGKIMWRKDDIAEIRDKLKANRDDVQFHLGSRIGHHVKKLMDGQHQIGGIIHNLDEKFGQIAIRLNELESQQKCLIMQNYNLTKKFDILLEMKKQERMNIFAVAVEYLPSKPLANSAWRGMRAVTAFLFTPAQLKKKDQPPEDISRILIQHFGRQKSVTDEILTIQVMVSCRGCSLATQPLLVQYKRKDAFRSFTITDALQTLKPSPERLPALRSTTRVMIIRSRQKYEDLSISASPDLQSRTKRYINPEFPVEFRESTDPSIQPSWPLQDNFSMDKLQQIAAIDSQYAIETEVKFPARSPKTHEAQLGLYIERDWSSTAKIFVQYCTFATLCQLASPLLIKYSGFATPQEALFFFLPWTIYLYAIFSQLYWGVFWKSLVSYQNGLPAIFLRIIQTRLWAIVLKVIQAISAVGIFVFWFRFLIWVFDYLIFGLDFITLIAALLLYQIILVYSIGLIIALVFRRKNIAKSTMMAWKFLTDFFLLYFDLYLNSKARKIVIPYISAIWFYYMALSTCERIVWTTPTYLFLAPSFGSIFAMVYLCHIAIVWVDDTLISQLFQVCYMLAQFLVLSMDDTATAWLIRLGNLIAYCITGSWIGRRWMRRRRKKLQLKKQQTV